MKLTTLRIREREFEVTVDTAGEFSAKVDGDQIRASSLEQLRERLIRATKPLKFAIDFLIFDNDAKKPRIRRGRCTGIHGSNGNLIVKYDDAEKTEQVYAWHLDECVDPAQAEEYRKVVANFLETQTALRAFERLYKLNVGALAKQAAARAEGDTE